MPHEVMAAVVGGIVPYAAPYPSDTAEVVAGRAPRDTAVDRAAPTRVAPVPAPVPPIKDTAADPRAPLGVANDDALCVPEGWTPAGNASAFDPAWATAKGPASPPSITPLIMASACSC